MSDRSLGTEIPRHIHQIWLGGDVPDAIKSWMDSWRRHHPTWNYTLWNDDVTSGLSLAPLAKRATSFAAAADILRVEILTRFGGLYVDADYECHRAVDRLISSADLVLLSEFDVLTNSFIAAVPSHRLVASLMSRASSLPDSAFENLSANLLKILGPWALTQTFTELDLTSDPAVTVLPPDYFRVPRTRNQDLLRWSSSRRYGTHHVLASWKGRAAMDLIRSTRLRTRVRRFIDLTAP